MIKNMPNAIIEIPKNKNLYNQKPIFEVLIKQDDRTIYHNKTYAVVMNLVQSVDMLDITKGEMEGDTQILGVGHPIIQFFALDQLRKKMKESGLINTAFMMIAMLIKNPSIRKSLLQVMKNASIKKE